MWKKKNTIWLLLVISLLKTILIGFFVFSGSIGLGPDEAQYWTWSQHLDLGYYSKPGGIAWIIYLSTKLFGNSEFAVRFPSLLIGFFLPFIIFTAGKKGGLSNKAAFQAALVMALTPFGILSSFLAITDVGMILFFSLALIPLAQALSQKATPNYLLMGVLIALGAQFKWSIYSIWLICVVSMLFIKEFRSIYFFSGAILSLFGLLPSFTWNYQKNFPTFRHVATQVATLEPQNQNFFKGNFFEFIGSQIALLSPFIFLLLIISIYVFYKNRHKLTRAELFFMSATGLTFLGFLVSSLFKKIQGNWVDMAYPLAAVLIGFYLQKKDSKKLFSTALSTSFCLTFFALSIPYLQETANLPIPFWMNPFRHNIGLHNVKDVLSEFGYNSKTHFLFSSKYQTTSQLHFYTEDQAKAYFLNLEDFRNNQFSLWPSLKEEKLNQNGYFVLFENDSDLNKVAKDILIKKQILQNYFQTVVYKGNKTLFSCNKKSLKRAHIFFCEAYNGNEPEKQEKY